jgi:hypothetical protein
MIALADDALLELWLIGQPRHPIDRSLLLLSSATPAGASEQLASLSLGQCNRQLAELREAMFGSAWQVMTDCRACGASLEFTLTKLSAALAASSATPEPEMNGLRPLNSNDIAAIATIGDRERARRELSRRAHGLSPTDAEALSDEEIAATAAALAKIDPHAEVLIEVACPDCGHGWEAALDLPSFVWHDIERAARAVLLDVAALARAYGWSEIDILRMGSRKRRLYRELASV